MGSSTQMCSTKYLSSMTTTGYSRKIWWTHTLSRRTKRSRIWMPPCVHSSPLCLLLPLTCSSDFRTQTDLSELSSLGHFLKGSSAALGVSKVQLSCEDIQHYGHLREGIATLTEAEAIVKITKSLARAREEYEEAKKWLESFYASYKVEE
jgi:HPt (histidine-containing phosphotransfer) domain-containing protein